VNAARAAPQKEYKNVCHIGTLLRGVSSGVKGKKTSASEYMYILKMNAVACCACFISLNYAVVYRAALGAAQQQVACRVTRQKHACEQQHKCIKQQRRQQ